ncbi:hypothetical protein SERLA73DRAFT_190779 [Serpula lacrymans var. lacrymans S7.3]|uniref:Uncharacterized protein n=2 Tax=Serpula lacrymans var. lacrymans TaxID=341189 RepID=F8QGC3_SERL3|nr:uncharacterized protein SERLADRAFT_459542 [Serpula lacrymans var. lacrymans S7.9]EGN92604.1 hypothetical protein SERLA73DRAFT_190779 [Serpula lacrymans var. lacrymans S7.3]EGO28765.1 hypothetical protein SERLADRAFT_459542 [Serpula lacrymans var. lacrymans S7.9]
MAEQAPSNSSDATSPARGRGRGKSRGGLGKYLRARGRGRGFGRPAQFTQRLVLEDEETIELDPDSEEAKELQRKYARRQLGSNADRYAEVEPELGSDGEEIREPEVDLSAFLERQKLSDDSGPSTVSPPVDDDDDIDHSLDHISSHRQPVSQSKKGRVQTLEWDEALEEMSREKAAAEATRDLKTRFRAKSEKLRLKPAILGSNRERKLDNGYVEAPPLPVESPRQADPKTEMQDFLDDLLG